MEHLEPLLLDGPDVNPNQIDDVAEALSFKYGGELPPEMQLVMKTFNEGNLTPQDALGYLYIFDNRRSEDPDSPRHSIV